MSSINPSLKAKIDEWLKWDKCESTATEIQILVDNEEYDWLARLLLNRLTFGTAGLRGRMGAGYEAMNELVIVQTAQGLRRYLENVQPDVVKSKGIVVGYDGRYNSKRFAELTACVFLSKNYPVHLFGKVAPTPLVPFSVSRLKCAVGVMVTASHNPKEDNGYKVYGPNGAQIVPPTDKHIQKCILECLEPEPNSWDTNILSDNELLTDPLPETFDNYLSIILDDVLQEHKVINEKIDLPFTYTAMHGVGYQYVSKIFDASGLKLICVPEQRDPDPEFPTVKFPNPEEGKSSLDLSFKTADENGSRIIIANDPDADRLACAEKDPNSGEWKVFNGNELGALLGWWAFHCHQTKYPNEPLSHCYMLSSTVSSKILKSMAKAEGFYFIETLTGFKWMGNLAYDLLQDGKRVMFSFEEAIGFMWGTNVLDKDGVSAAVHLGTMASYLYHHGLSLAEQLSEIYQEYGYHVSCNSYFVCHDGEKIRDIFERLRNYNGPNTYPSNLIEGKYEIVGVRDLTTGYDNTQSDERAILPVSADSQMITFTFKNGLVATLRTSGTEPKIKYYTELCASPTQTDRKEIEHTLKEMVDGIIFEFLQPVENGLLPKSD